MNRPSWLGPSGPQSLLAQKREPEPAPPLTAQQQRYLEILTQNPNQSFFLAGAAGTGKTLLLQQVIQTLRKQGRRVRVAAPTGLAAQHLGGTTLARLLGLGLARHRSQLEEVNFERAERNLDRVRVLVLDEVSMASGDLLELADLVLREVRGQDRPFGGLQVIFCGDFLQLPPVRGKHEPAFEIPWAFEYPPFAETVPLVLTENLRQQQEEDHRLLQEVRQGQISPAGQKRLAQMTSRSLSNPVYLLPRREEVERINRLRLEGLPGPPHVYRTEVLDGRPFPEVANQLPIGDAVHLKVGAPVIILMNDRYGTFVNGSQGIVQELAGVHVRVRLRNQTEVNVPLREWEIKDAQGQPTGVVQGLPLSLGWAATIHRAQGMTLDTVATDLYRCWEPGQAYVALSRARSLEEVAIFRTVQRVKVDPVALAYTNSLLGEPQ